MTRALFALAALALLSGCITTKGVVANDVPECERLIPPGLLEDTPPADRPVSAKLADGHDDARPWQEGFLKQTVKLEIANARTPALDHIYRTCLDQHRERRARDTGGFFGRLFGGK